MLKKDMIHQIMKVDRPLPEGTNKKSHRLNER